MLLQLRHHPPLLQPVHLDHRGQQLEVVAGVAGELAQGLGIFGKTAAAEPHAGTQEGGADALVEAHAAGDLLDVGARLLADVGDLVDEGDLGRQERVGGQLDHLGGGDVGADELAADGRVDRGHRVGRPLGAGVGADHNAVWVHEVVNRRALAQELGA